MSKLLTTKMIKHSRSWKNRRTEAQLRSVLIFHDLVWRAFAR